MRALRLDPAGSLSVATAALPTHADDCLIRVTRAGICGTDLQMLDGYASFAGIPGHEFVGIVEDARDADGHWIGKRVVGEINVGCGACPWCDRGIKEHCLRRTVLGIRGRDGAFAEYLSLPAANLHEVPSGVDDEAAVFVEPIAAACRIFEQVAIAPDTRVAVIGDGRLGNLIAQVLRTRTAQVVLFGRHIRKLQIAADMGLNAQPGDGLRDERYDVVVDATGRAQGLARALEIVEPRGTVVLKSTFYGDASQPLWPIPVHEISVIGSRCGQFAPALALLASNAIRTRPLIVDTLPLSAFEQAFERARTDLKVLLAPGAE
jgi:threonine dehydrogenase-like Zn-dependent dehydrogenase